MNRYISYGGGKNSTAMAILLFTDPRYAAIRSEGEIRVIMANTGNEWPETYDFVLNTFNPWLKSIGHRGIEWVSDETETLEEHCLKRKIIPSRLQRWCSDKFKIRPIVDYLERQGMLPCVQYMGIHYGEALKRMRTTGRDDITNEFPLVDLKVDEAGCVEILKRMGWGQVQKSGCFYCPHSRKGQIIELESKHPDLFDRSVKMEANGSGFARGFHLFSKKYALPEWIVKGRIRKDNSGSGCAAACFTGRMIAPKRTRGRR